MKLSDAAIDCRSLEITDAKKQLVQDAGVSKAPVDAAITRLVENKYLDALDPDPVTKAARWRLHV